MFVFLCINSRYHDFMILGGFFILEFSYLGLPPNKSGEILVVNKEIEYCLCFGQMDKLRYLCPDNCLEISVMLFFDC